MLTAAKIVTKESDDGTFLVGDHLFYYEDGTVLCKEAGGWLDKEDVAEASIGMECEDNKPYLDAIAERLQSRLDKITTSRK
jgi:hypothetical protein